MSDELDDHLGEIFDVGGKKYRLGKSGVSSTDSCFFCGDPGPCRFIHWTAQMIQGVVVSPCFFPQCAACHDRPKHILDAIIACSGKMAD
jgi:hypothetical protein